MEKAWRPRRESNPPLLVDSQHASPVAHVGNAIGPTLWNRTRTSGTSARRADHLTQEWDKGCSGHPTSCVSVVKDRQPPSAPLTLATQGAHVASAAVSS